MILLPHLPPPSHPSCTSSTHCRAEQAGALLGGCRPHWLYMLPSVLRGFVPLQAWFAPHLAGSSPCLCWVLCALASSPIYAVCLQSKFVLCPWDVLQLLPPRTAGKHLLVDAPLLTEGPWVCQGAQGSMQGLELSSSHLNVLLGFPN